MKPRDRKLEILRQLGQESEPICLIDLSKKLGFEFNDRTIRRSLNQLVEEGLVQKLGHTRGSRYLAVSNPGRGDEKGAKSKSFSSFFSSDSLESIRKVSKPLFEREPLTYDQNWLQLYEPNITYYVPSHFRRQLTEAGKRSAGKDPAGTYAHQIFNRLIIDLSYNSSRLEGNTYSLLDTERLLLQGDSPAGKLDEEKVMILNHKEAIRYLVDNAPRIEVSRSTICTIHYLLSDGLVEPAEAGKVRKHGVRIGGSTYIPFEGAIRLDQQLEKIASIAARIEDPFEQSFFLLVHVSYLQAFADVNKRTARLCANIPLVKNNLVPLAFSDVRVEDYMSSIISIYELQDVRPMVDLYVFSYLRTCAVYDSTVKSMGFDEVRVRYRQQRREALREIIKRKLVGDELNKFIHNEAVQIIPQQDWINYIDDIKEDLQQMDLSRIAGLGITCQQFEEWLKKEII